MDLKAYDKKYEKYSGEYVLFCILPDFNLYLFINTPHILKCLYSTPLIILSNEMTYLKTKESFI